MSRADKIIAVSGTVVIVVMIVFTIIITSVSVDDYFFDLSEFDFDDEWILGNTVENVRERYGEFDTEWTYHYQSVGYRLGMGRPADMDGVFPFYYYMDYDSDGIVTKVYVSYDPRGG